MNQYAKGMNKTTKRKEERINEDFNQGKIRTAHDAGYSDQ